MSNIDDLKNTNDSETSLYFENNEFDDGDLQRDDGNLEENEDRLGEQRFIEREDRIGEVRFGEREGRVPDGGDLEGGREGGREGNRECRNRNHRCCCLGIRGPVGPRGCPGERGPRGITTLSGGLYLENSCKNQVTLAPNEAVPLSQVRNSIGTGISFVNNNVVVAPGTYYFSWSVLTRSCTSDPNVVITLENIIGMIPKIATSGIIRQQNSSTPTAINATGSTVVTFNKMAVLRLFNASGHDILLLGADGEGSNNFMASMTVLRLA